MKNIDNKKGFTLVELIIVITILSVLASIAFISFQGFTRDARNTKRGMELTSLEKKIELSLMEGVQLKNLVKGTGSTIMNNTTSPGTVGIRIGGVEGYSALSGIYVGGDINTDILGGDGKNFIDPVAGVPYKIAITNHGQRYEIAATIENNFGGDSLIKGTYNQRKSSSTRGRLNPDLTSTGSTQLYFSGITFIETGLLVGDVVKVASGSVNQYTITSADNYKITITPALLDTGENVYLSGDETVHLIKRDWIGSHFSIKVGEIEGKDLPYKLSK